MERSESEGLPPRARPFAYGLLAILVACAAFQIEWWPLSSFHLFSGVRRPVHLGWEVVTVDGGGAEQPIDWASLPPAYKGRGAVASLLHRMNEQERTAVLREWGEAGAAAGNDVAAVRLYRIARRTPVRRGAPSVLVWRTLRYEVKVRGP